jgi:hypothetical protein
MHFSLCFCGGAQGRRWRCWWGGGGRWWGGLVVVGWWRRRGGGSAASTLRCSRRPEGCARSSQVGRRPPGGGVRHRPAPHLLGVHAHVAKGEEGEGAVGAGLRRRVEAEGAVAALDRVGVLGVRRLRGEDGGMRGSAAAGGTWRPGRAAQRRHLRIVKTRALPGRPGRASPGPTAARGAGGARTRAASPAHRTCPAPSAAGGCP